MNSHNETEECGTPVPADRYDQDYFLTECEGYSEYLATVGREVSPRLAKVMSLVGAVGEMKVLDVACGRGELLLQCRRVGGVAVGVDYSASALSLAREAIRLEEEETGTPGPFVVHANAKSLPFGENSFDRVVMSDIIEHLHDWELKLALQEAYRVLCPGGALVVHTMPNVWYHRFGYPLYRCVQQVRGIAIPVNPGSRWRYADVHVNEQSPLALRRTLSTEGFRARVWVEDYRNYLGEPLLLRFLMLAVTRIPILRLIFCDDIFALVRKPSGDPVR